MFNLIDLSPSLNVIDTGESLKISPTVQKTIDSIWDREKEKRGDELFNGRLFNVTEVSRETITGFYIDYAVSVAQYHEPSLFDALSVRPLSVSGLVTLQQGTVFGLRNENLTTDAGLWELAPSGGVDDSVRLDDGTIDIGGQFLNELGEELNIPADAAEQIAPIALLEDSQTHVCDIVVEARLSIGAEMLFPLFNECGREEYVSIDVIPEYGIKGFVQLMKESMTPASMQILAYKGYIKLLGSPG